MSVRSRVGLAVAGAVASVSLGAAGCWPGDCFPEIGLTVTIAQSVTVGSGATLVVVNVPEIYDGDVTGVDAEGVPVGAREHGADASLSIVSGQATYEVELLGAPYPTWFYAFVETDGNLTLDPGEAFGVDPENPTDLGSGNGCRDYAGQITIDRIR